MKTTLTRFYGAVKLKILSVFLTNLKEVPADGLVKPVGVRGREFELFIPGILDFLLDVLFRRLEVGVLPFKPVLRGMRLKIVESSV